MLVTIEKYFLLFIIYSILGWGLEVAFVSIQNKRIVNRGFLIGPYCPIYGFGGVLITVLLKRYQYDALVLFVMTVITCGFLEYMTSWLMEVIFKARWWDYSNQKFNLNGRVSLRTLICFGVLGLLITYVLNPIIFGLIDKLNNLQLNISSVVLAVIFMVDCGISFRVIISFRKVTKQVNKERTEDNTEQITNMVRQVFAEKSIFNRRFINAYPKLEAIKIKVKEIQDKIKENVNEVRDNLKENMNEVKENLNDRKEELSNRTQARLHLSTKKIQVKLKKRK